MKEIYLDSCVLVAYFSTKKQEKEKKKLVKECLQIFSNLKDVQLCISNWAIAETVNVLISKLRHKRSFVAKYEEELANRKRLQNIKINFIEVSPVKDYDFTEFFYDIRQGILRYHSGVGDIIHSVVMKNNNIKSILTFDEKNDFKQIPGLLVIHPKDIVNIK